MFFVCPQIQNEFFLPPLLKKINLLQTDRMTISRFSVLE